LSDYSISRLENPTMKDIADILNLFRGIKGRTCSAAAYLDYINQYWDSVYIAIVRNNSGDIIAFTQASSPSLLEPKRATLPFSHSTPQCPREWAYNALQLAEEWMRLLGATSYSFTTVRSPKALKRAWKVRQSKEILMEKDLYE